MRNLRTEEEISSSWKGDMTKTLVSISCLAYNHEKFIEDTLEGFLIQETNFPFEILIHDDASTDKTADIIREYETVYPNIIKPIYQSENQWSKNKKVIRDIQYGRMQSKYIAFCEGDDYWADPFKLQKQVEFLEANPQYSMCFTNSIVVDSENKIIKNVRVPEDKRHNLTQKDILSGYCPPINTALLKTELAKKHPPDFSGIINGDFFLFTLITQYGEAGYLDINSAAYRMHSNSIWSTSDDDYKAINFIKVNRKLADLVKSENRQIALSHIQGFYKTLNKFNSEEDFLDRTFWTPQTAMLRAIRDAVLRIEGYPKTVLSIDKNPVLEKILLRKWPEMEISVAKWPEYNVQNLHQFEDESFDIVFSQQLLEHVPKPWLAGKEIVRVLREGGLGIHTTCAYNPRNGYPVFKDYYRFLPDGLAELFEGVTVLEKGGWGSKQALIYNLTKDDQDGELGGRRFVEALGKQNDENYPWYTWIIFKKNHREMIMQTENINSVKDLISKGDLEEAKDLCYEILTEDLKNTEAYYQLGEIFYSQKNYELALRNYTTVFESSKNRIEAAAKIVLTNILLNRRNDAEKFLKKVIVENPYDQSLIALCKELKVMLTWEDIKSYPVIKLYAGDIPDSKEYKNLIGLSIEKNDYRHIRHDITSPFPLNDNSVDSFQAEDVFEHIDYNKLPGVINEIFRVLKPGGYFRLSVPDYNTDVYINRSLKDNNGNILFDPGGGGTIENPGHLWYPRYDNVAALLSQTKFKTSGEIKFLHYYKMDGTPVANTIDYSKGFIIRTPDNDERVKNPYRPLSLVVDMIKVKSIENNNQISSTEPGNKFAGNFQVNKSITREYHGTEYGGWYINPDNIGNETIVYSFGAGEDISFDLSLIENYGVNVFSFDPTPKSISWINKQKLPAKFKFFEYGIADFDGTVKFYPPENPEHVSHTLLYRSSTSEKYIEVPVRKLESICKTLGHKKIDILKMDIEGAEYSVIEDIVKSDIEIDQILVEFHDRFEGVDKTYSQIAISTLLANGYEIFSISSSKLEYSFIKSGSEKPKLNKVTSPVFQEIPVVLVTYNRPWHTEQVLKSLQKHNIKNLYIFSDAPKRNEDIEGVNATRKLIESVRWTVPKLIYQKENTGLAKSITTAVDTVFKEYDRLILLEDDCVPQRYFFEFMYTCLNKYEDNKQIFGVTGYTVPVPQGILSGYPYDLYFFPRIGSWGWGTWKSKWNYKIDDLRFLKNEIERKGIDINEPGNDVPVMLEKLFNGTLNDVWTMSWLLSVHLNKGFYIYPTASHILNIGLDGTGVHCGKTDKFDTVTAISKPSRFPDKIIFNERIAENFYLKHNLNNSSTKNLNSITENKVSTHSALEVYNSIKQNINNQSSGITSSDKSKLKMLNLGCGSRYHKDWINIDFKGNNNGVIAYNLRDKLPFNKNEIDIVYHSHLLEHFTKEYAPEFLKECYRVLKPGGIIRVVVPDLEQIARQYINLLERSIRGDKDSQAKYEWIMLEMFDQTVRNYSGGEMLKYWQQEKIPAEEFVIERVGSEAKNAIEMIRKNASLKDNKNVKDLTPIEIGSFRLSGEVHQWMYDRYSLGKLLKQTGFKNIKVCSAHESGVPEFSKYLLDVEPDNSVRKPDSLFMEAMK